MDFFGIGAMELLLVLVLALIVMGPRQLPAAARKIATMVRKLRRMWAEVSTDIARELNMEDQLGDIRNVTDAIGTVRKTRSPAALIGALVGEDIGKTPPKPPSPGELFLGGDAGKGASSKPPTPAQVLFGEQESKPTVGKSAGIVFKDKAADASSAGPESAQTTEEASDGPEQSDSVASEGEEPENG